MELSLPPAAAGVRRLTLSPAGRVAAALRRLARFRTARRESARGTAAPQPPARTEPARPARLPDFFIAGAARSGTTSLWEYLRQHPDVFMPPVFEQKEPSYFCELYGIKDENVYCALFDAAGERKRVGEASGPYLTSPDSPATIRRVIPHAQFIISLRNPADRAYSLYKWMHAHGYESLPTFAAALRAEREERLGNPEFQRHNGQYYHNFLYFDSGRYAAQVQRFFATFGRERVRVLVFEEFIRRPAEHVRELFQFLDVDPSFAPRLEVHNASSPGYGAYPPELRARLLDDYAPDVRQLEHLLGRALRSVWI